jgi:hypothetical protein
MLEVLDMVNEGLSLLSTLAERELLHGLGCIHEILAGFLEQRIELVLSRKQSTDVLIEFHKVLFG